MSPRAWASLMLTFVSACAAPAPPPRSPEDLAGCSPGSYGVLGPDACSDDHDCALCRDGSACGAPISRAHALERGAACEIPRDDALVCDADGVACCQHRCVLLLGPPVFGRGTEDPSDLPRP